MTGVEDYAYPRILIESSPRQPDSTTSEAEFCALCRRAGRINGTLPEPAVVGPDAIDIPVEEMAAGEQATGLQLAILDEKRPREQALEDLPDEAPKRQKYEHHPVGATQVAQLVMNELQHPGQGVRWANMPCVAWAH